MYFKRIISMKKITLLLFVSVFAFFMACTPKAQKYFEKAKVDFKEKEYEHAIQNYQQALSEGYDAKQCNYMIAESYRRSNRIQEAEPYYKKAIEAGLDVEEAHFFYGYALKSSGNYEGAIAQFQEYAKNGTNFDYINRSKREIENLKKLEEISARPKSYIIDNIEDLNTEFAEYGPHLYNKKLYFTSNREAKEMHAANGTGFTDIYEFAFDGVSKFSGQATHTGNIINTDNAHEANCIFSKDGKTLIFARSNDGAKKKAPDCDIFITTMKSDGSWNEPVKMPFNDSLAWDACPFLSADEKTLYFASNREGGQGNVDLYKVTKDANGQWTVVENLGAPINTHGNEMFPYVDKKLNRLYFSSDGHPSFGSLDIFYVKTENGKSTVENMGLPINSSFDDFNLIWDDSLSGYFVSNRKGDDAKGDDDIYHFKDDRTAKYCVDGTSFGESRKDPKNIKKYLLPGAKVFLLAENGDTIATTLADANGHFEFCDIKPKTNYFLAAEKEKYFEQTKEDWVPFSVDETPFNQLKQGENIIKKKAEVKLVKLENIIIVKNILYDYDKWDIRPDAALELDKIVELMVKNPILKIELGSHTDERGSAQYNRVLADKRAKAAVDYIVSKGIDRNRLVAKGYGEDTPAIRNAQTEEQHQTNRRTTFKILNHFDEDLEIKVEN
ncbi:MAG: OmpA family protein [Cytophagaceae bacterium]|nr:OmpA family protein [Cytophagaceae bacterium]